MHCIATFIVLFPDVKIAFSWDTKVCTIFQEHYEKNHSFYTKLRLKLYLNSSGKWALSANLGFKDLRSYTLFIEFNMVSGPYI